MMNDDAADVVDDDDDDEDECTLCFHLCRSCECCTALYCTGRGCASDNHYRDYDYDHDHDHDTNDDDELMMIPTTTVSPSSR